MSSPHHHSVCRRLAGLGILVATLSAPATATAGTSAAAGDLPHATGVQHTRTTGAGRAAYASATDTGLTLTEVTPAVAGPGVAVTVAGTVRPADPGGPAPSVVRVVRGKATSTRSDVDAWASGSSPAAGTEIARAPLTTSTPGQPAGSPTFRITLAPEQIRSTAAVTAIPLAIEVLDAEGGLLTGVRTFVGWSRAVDSAPISIAWLVPLTLDPDPALVTGSGDEQAAAWTNQLGPNSRVSRLLRATSAATVGYAVDPALLTAHPSSGGTTAAESAGVAAARAALAQSLVAAEGSHPVFALPGGDADLSALLALAAGSDNTPPDVAAASATLVAEAASGASALERAGLVLAGRLAWPADGPLTLEEERALTTAYRGVHPTLVLSAAATGSGRLTPPAPASTSEGVTVLRADDRLGALLADAARPDTQVLSTQEFVAQTAALYAERPSIARSFLVASPVDLDPDPAAFARFLDQAGHLPWVQTVSPAAEQSAAASGGTSELPAAESLVRPASASGAPGGARDAVAAIARSRELSDTYAAVLPATSNRVAQWKELAAAAVGVRWRDVPARAGLLERLTTSTALTDALYVGAQTTNFLADEGVLQVTVVNDLDEPVSGVQLNLWPGNARIRVLEPPAPVSIGAGSRAIVPVRVAAVAQGLVPVTAWLTTPSGERVGAPQELSVRSAPPGVWLYVVLGGLAALILVLGVVRALRRPREGRTQIELDPILPTPEVPLEDPVDRP